MLSLPLAAVIAPLFLVAPSTDRAHRLGEILDRAWIFARPEWVQMAISILKDESMDPSKGWWRSGGKLRDWSWLRERYDANKDGKIDRAELPVGDAELDALDRDLDGVLTAGDFDGSGGVQRSSPAVALFRRLDADSNGRVTRDEMKALFDRADSLGLGFLTQDDLRLALTDREAAARVSEKDENDPTPCEMLYMLFTGQLGSLREGPRVGEMAPDFQLPVHGGRSGVALSSHRGKRPVVLIFGSFT